MKSFSEQVVANLREIISSKGLKQADVGRYANISESQFSRVLKGSVQLSLNQLADIASGLEMNVIDVITFPDKYYKLSESEADTRCQEVKATLTVELGARKGEKVLLFELGENGVKILDKS